MGVVKGQSVYSRVESKASEFEAANCLRNLHGLDPICQTWPWPCIRLVNVRFFFFFLKSQNGELVPPCSIKMPLIGHI